MIGQSWLRTHRTNSPLNPSPYLEVPLVGYDSGFSDRIIWLEDSKREFESYYHLRFMIGLG